MFEIPLSSKDWDKLLSIWGAYAWFLRLFSSVPRRYLKSHIFFWKIWEWVNLSIKISVHFEVNECGDRAEFISYEEPFVVIIMALVLPQDSQ